MKYYSEITKKIYDTEKDLKAAEKEVADREAKKAEAAKNKKADAAKVEEAFKVRNAARRAYNEAIVQLKKDYNTAIMEAKKTFDEAVAEAVKVKDAAEDSYNKALKEFTDKHSEGYHVTLKDGDNVVTLSSSSDKVSDGIFKEYNNLLDSLLKFWF